MFDPTMAWETGNRHASSHSRGNGIRRDFAESLLRRCEPLILGVAFRRRVGKRTTKAPATIRIRDQCFLNDGLPALGNAPTVDRLICGHPIPSTQHYFDDTRIS